MPTRPEDLISGRAAAGNTLQVNWLGGHAFKANVRRLAGCKPRWLRNNLPARHRGRPQGMQRTVEDELHD
jgi:hypothetical protein